MTEATKTPTKPNKSNQIRELLAQGVTPSIIAKEMGVVIQYVHSVRRRDIEKARKAKAKAKKAATVRRYVKSGKYAKKAETPKETTPLITQEELDALREAVQRPATQYIEVEVPQPFSHYTFWQRLRILFLGRV
jgi:hypothetical protein